ncbi:phage antirepressor, partial [Streptomyces albidoflavus]
ATTDQLDSLVARAKQQAEVLSILSGIVSPDWLETKARLVAARALGEEPEVDPLDVPLYVPDFLKSKGLKRGQINSVQSWFGRRAASLFEAEHGEKPGKRQSDTTSGAVRETYAWTERHRPVFEETWDRYYADQFPTQLDLGGAA